jgi:hypothetical protein
MVFLDVGLTASVPGAAVSRSRRCLADCAAGALDDGRGSRPGADGAPGSELALKCIKLQTLARSAHIYFLRKLFSQQGPGGPSSSPGKVVERGP